jgi:threonine dehydratase
MTDTTNALPLKRASVVAAHALIKSHVHLTPVLTNTTITTLASTPQTAESLIGTEWEGRTPASPKLRLWFKCENLQKVGAFKARGAFHALERLKQEEGNWEGALGEERRKKGVATHSSGTLLNPSRLIGEFLNLTNIDVIGNHAQALALAAQSMGIPAYVVMPTISNILKIEATRGYGASIVFSGSTSTEREAAVNEVVEKTGARLIPPYDHPDIMFGQGTQGLELQSQVEAMIANGEGNIGGKGKGLDAIMAPCGGGGMLSGIALSCEGTGIKVFGAEPSFEGADDCKRGLAAGKRIEAVKTLTIAEGLRTPVGPWPWKVISNPELVTQMFSVTEDQIKKALRLVLERMKVVVEPSAVVPLAVALFNEDFRAMVEREGGEDGWDLGLIFSGGNISLEALGELFQVHK